MQYVGRFAPTPSGPLHFGSLVTALASWLDARHHQGRWLLRIEDLDPPREEPGASDRILRTLEGLGLTWDGEVVYQSRRASLYTQAWEELKRRKQAYPCSCTRKELSGQACYPGYCRSGPRHPNRPLAWRLAVDTQQTLCWEDQIQGQQSWSLAQLGDPIIRRKDHLWAYQLAVVVDDIDQGVTHILRGIDLLDSTPWQIYLHKLLEPKAPAFHYAHLPVIVNASGQKLSKQNLAPAIQAEAGSRLLYLALRALRQPLDEAWQQSSPEQLLAAAVAGWNPDAIPRVAALNEDTLA